MKRPNPIFLGVITLAALLPHAPKLLPGSTDDFVRELTPPSVQTAPFDTQIEHLPDMPTAELPSISAETSDCAGSGLDENQDRHQDSEPAEKRSDSPAMDTSQNCDAGRHSSPHNALSQHLANALL